MPSRWPLTNADQVQAFVAVTGAHCPKCRYPLVGLPSDICPECGKKLSVPDLCRRRWLDVPLRAASWKSPLRILAALNVLVALAILASALAHRGHLPLLSWLAPGVLGAFAFSIQYIAVFAKYSPTRYDPIERWGEGTAMLILLIQIAGLTLMWV